MQTFLLLTLFYFLYLVHRGKGYGYDASAINANIDFILEGCEGNYVYNIERDYNSSEQYVSIVTINGDAKGISMECSDGTKVLSDTSQGWFYEYGIGEGTAQGWQTIGYKDLSPTAECTVTIVFHYCSCVDLCVTKARVISSSSKSCEIDDGGWPSNYNNYASCGDLYRYTCSSQTVMANSCGPCIDPSSPQNVASTPVCSVPQTRSPTMGPTPHPTLYTTVSPTSHPIVKPNMHPTMEPTPHPTLYTTVSPTSHPIVEPIIQPTEHPTSVRTKAPVSSPTFSPTLTPTPYPTQKYRTFVYFNITQRIDHLSADDFNKDLTKCSLVIQETVANIARLDDLDEVRVISVHDVLQDISSQNELGSIEILYETYVVPGEGNAYTDSEEAYDETVLLIEESIEDGNFTSTMETFAVQEGSEALVNATSSTHVDVSDPIILQPDGNESSGNGFSKMVIFVASLVCVMLLLCILYYYFKKRHTTWKDVPDENYKITTAIDDRNGELHQRLMA